LQQLNISDTLLEELGEDGLDDGKGVGLGGDTGI